MTTRKSCTPASKDVEKCRFWMLVYMFGSYGLGPADRNRTLEQVLLYPRDDVARLVERLAVDEQAGNLAFSADDDERLLGSGIGRDIALGNGHAVIRQETLHLNAIRAAGHNVQRELMISSHRSPIG